ncbi:MAG: efflux RND transporter periplasmic adaptor subunit [Pseudomonadota bacterium]
MSLVPGRSLSVRSDVRLRLAAGLALAVWLGGCGGQAEPPAKAKVAEAHLVELAPVETARLAYAAPRPGTLRARHAVKVVNQEEGRVDTVAVREGDRVAVGQVLAQYDDRVLRAELDQARAALAQAEAEFDRTQRLVGEGFLSLEVMTRATTARDIARAEVRLLEVRLQHFTLTSPLDGVVSERRIEPGDATPRHSHLLTVIDPARLITEVAVSELVLPRLRVGGRVQVRIDALGTATFPGRITRLHPALDPATRAGLVEVTLTPQPAGARPGQFCRVTFEPAGAQQRVVPLAALQRDASGEHVYVYRDDARVAKVAVRAGLRLADRVEILEGLASGDQVVVKGFLDLADGVRVKPVSPPAATAPGRPR